MDHDDMRRRFNNSGYINWLKANQCLRILKENLAPYVNEQLSAFHREMIGKEKRLGQQCASSCRPIENKLSNLCEVCSTWQTVILEHHEQPQTTVNWDNCDLSNWGTNHLEVAKAFMPRGQRKVKAAAQFDIAALLNLINYCKRFHSVDRNVVREMITHRNNLMHSPDFQVTDQWMKSYRRTLTNLLRQFSHIPQMATAERQIKEMLAADLFIVVSRVYEADTDTVVADFQGYHMITADLISQWERELLQERLEELLNDVDDVNTLENDQLKSLGLFLEDNKDLGEHFSTELQTINSLKKRKRQKTKK